MPGSALLSVRVAVGGQVGGDALLQRLWEEEDGDYRRGAIAQAAKTKEAQAEDEAEPWWRGLLTIVSRRPPSAPLPLVGG